VYRLDSNPVRPGAQLLVHLSGPVHTDVDVGRRVVESVLTGSAASTTTRHSTVLHEEWAGRRSPRAGSSVALRIPIDQPTTYLGTWVSIEHQVVLRPAGAAAHGGMSPGDIVLAIDVVP
jgi:hypothetical protein